VQRLPRILLQYFDFGKIEGRFTSERAYEATASGIPRPLVIWLMNVAYGFVPVVMENAGARGVELVIRPGELEREERGMAWRRSWLVVTWNAWAPPATTWCSWAWAEWARPLAITSRGASRRTPASLPSGRLASPEPRDRVIAMQERAFELEAESEAEGTEPETIALDQITARTLVGVGELDKSDFHEIADRLAAEIAGAENTVIPGAGHLPSLERPEATASIICRFLRI